MKGQIVGKTEEMALSPFLPSSLPPFLLSSFFVSCGVNSWIFLVHFHPLGLSAPLIFYIIGYVQAGQGAGDMHWGANEDLLESAVSFHPEVKLRASAYPLPATTSTGSLSAFSIPTSTSPPPLKRCFCRYILCR